MDATRFPPVLSSLINVLLLSLSLRLVLAVLASRCEEANAMRCETSSIFY
jgi:hypothetical protein